MHRRTWLLTTLSFALAACSSAAKPRETRTGTVLGGAGASVGAPNIVAGSSGSAGAVRQGDNPTTVIVAAAGTASRGEDVCSDAAKLVYTVDQDGRFSSFNPRTNPPTFIDITPSLKCPATAGIFGVAPTPYSMSVDRNAVAWVLYSSGELFRVSTADGSCQRTTFKSNQSGFMLMGMGFVANTKLSTLDTLYVAGGAGPDSGGASRLGTLDTGTLAVAPLQQLTGWPELTGTALAELWGFYPDTSPPKVARLNKTTGAEELTYPLATLQGQPAAWAFAFWGGDFWLFLMRVDDTDTTVYRVNGSTGAMSEALTHTGRSIVGAGVSTCAPVDLQ
jgi:hypothetical protein